MERFNPIIGNPVADSAALLRRIAFFLLFLVLPVAAVVGRRTLVILAPISIALLIIAVLLDGKHKPILPSLKQLMVSQTFLLGLLFAGWCALSLLWSPFQESGSERLLGSLTTIAMIFAGYLALPERMRSSNLYLLPIGIGIAALLTLAIELAFLSESRIISLEDVMQRGLLVLVLLFWPALSWLRSRQRDIPAVALAGVLIAALCLTPNRTALWAFILGFAGYLASKIAAEKATRVIACITAGLLAFAPLLPFILQPVAALLPGKAFAASLRVSRHLITSNPMQIITGEGFDAANQARLAGVLDFHAPISSWFQIWYELGIVGAWSAAALIFVVISGAPQRYGSLTPGIVGSFLSAYAFAIMGSGAAQSWWMTALACTVLIFIAIARGQFRTRRPRIFFVSR